MDRIEVTEYSTLICEMLTAGRRDRQAFIIWSTFALPLIEQLEDREPVPASLARLVGRYPPDWRAVDLAWQHGVITGAILNGLLISETFTLAVVFQCLHDKKRPGLRTENLKKIWHRFRPVAHLWAALDYRRLHLSDLATLSDVDLNSFLQLAESIRRKGIRRVWPSHSRGQTLPRETSIQVSLKGFRLLKVTQRDVRLVCGTDGLPMLDMLGRRMYTET